MAKDKNTKYYIIGIVLLVLGLFVFKIVPMPFAMIGIPINYLGDLDGNGYLDGADLVPMRSLISGLSPICANDDCTVGDLDNNGVYDGYDLKILQSIILNKYLGDIDKDGYVLGSDLVYMRTLILGLNTSICDYSDCVTADIDGDGNYTENDLTLLQALVLNNNPISQPENIEFVSDDGSLLTLRLIANGRGRSGIAILSNNNEYIEFNESYVITNANGEASFNYLILQDYNNFTADFSSLSSGLGKYTINSVNLDYEFVKAVSVPSGGGGGGGGGSPIFDCYKTSNNCTFEICYINPIFNTTDDIFDNIETCEDSIVQPSVSFDYFKYWWILILALIIGGIIYYEKYY